MQEFTYTSYLSLLRELGERYAIRPLRDFDAADEPRLYLRHDIDLCPQAALQLAEREAAAGFASTYMFIPTSPLYSLSANNLLPIVDLGHEVALHFDYLTSGISDPADSHAMGKEIERQCRVLEEWTGVGVASLSFHRPIPQFLRGPDFLYGKVNAYASTLMDCYRSDSAGKWRQDPHDASGPVVQLLTHPIWWGDDHIEPVDRLEQYAQAKGGGDRIAALIAETVPGVQSANA